jgi:hypothetical protein
MLLILRSFFARAARQNPAHSAHSSPCLRLRARGDGRPVTSNTDCPACQPRQGPAWSVEPQPKTDLRFRILTGCGKRESVMLSATKHLLYLIESKQSRSFALLRMTWYRAFFRSLLKDVPAGHSHVYQGSSRNGKIQRYERSQEVIENKGDHFIANCNSQEVFENKWVISCKAKRLLMYHKLVQPARA